MCELFFVCSGILEALNHHCNYEYTLEETFSIIRKKLKSIYPLYFVTFAIAAVLGAVGLREWNIADNTLAAVINLLMLQSWFPELKFSFNGVSWFVTDLLLCYLITPALSLTIRHLEDASCRSRGRVSHSTYFVPAIGIFFVRLLLETAAYKKVISINTHVFPLMRILEYSLAFICGCWILRFALSRREMTARNKATDSLVEVTALSCYLFLIWLLDGYWISRPICVVAAIGLVAVFVCCRGIVSEALSLNFFSWFSPLQMPFYMFHQLVIDCCNALLGVIIPRAWVILVAFCTAILVSMLWNGGARKLSRKIMVDER